MAGPWGFLVGLYVLPLLLLRLGHRFKDRTRAAKRAFWGGVVGHSAGLLLAVTLSMAPPVWWGAGPVWRDFLVHWSMVAGTLLGMAAGGWSTPARSAEGAPPAR